ncbi:hypothetical protein CDO52_08025 [Nocardiopsis gilva YIM 90087]|uniref:Uncharacterized protein n=1 Tax=Nocardiopsis gilva YIM 90087 TaxID=1235441 RepID=A0A223S3T0_9ACTN|nr:hypothetical protein CDO52_08025 [Nocardiopsis gilva YIM 90087]
MKVTSTVRLVELEKLDPTDIELEEGVYAGEWILHLSPQVRIYLQTLGGNSDMAVVNALIAMLREVRAEILSHDNGNRRESRARIAATLPTEGDAAGPTTQST